MTQALSISIDRPAAWKNATTHSELTFDHLYDLAEWLVVRADRDPKWQDAYAIVQNTIRRLDWTDTSYPWIDAAKFLLGMGIGLTALDLRALGNRNSNYVGVLRAAGIEVVGVKMAPEPRFGPRRKRYYRADLVPPSEVAQCR